MQIFVDADACPVVDIVETIAEKYNISITLLCDTNHILYSDYSEVIVVSAGADDLTLLAAIIECEAGGESYECQLAVGAAVINRVKSSSYPNSISGVIYQKGQFGPASSGKLARKLSGRISSSCYSAAQEAMSGVDNTGGCTSFNDHGSGISIGNMKFR
jgi:spore germination cell wall hydrolase CwlJ-like protein